MSETEEKKKPKQLVDKILSSAIWIVIVLGFFLIGYGLFSGISTIFSVSL